LPGTGGLFLPRGEALHSNDPRKATYDLALVMPVYNEEGCIADVVRSWYDRLMALDIRFVMIIVNDGSTDGTAGILRDLSDDNRITVIHQSNRGHGPAILRGYRQAVPCAEWVFQCDSDNEMSPDSFGELWTRRGAYDAVLGFRQNRHQNASRGFITRCSQLTVRLVFGSSIQDVNTPYRLMRSCVLGSMLDHIPPDAFAPNIIIGGALASCGARGSSVPVPSQFRRTGRVSIAKWRLWKGAFRSLWQTIVYGRKIRRALRIETSQPALESPSLAPGALRIQEYSRSVRTPSRRGSNVDAGT
jgi:dolichol-phosphate mannosyltransferase